jgi:hypothetical protein
VPIDRISAPPRSRHFLPLSTTDSPMQRLLTAWLPAPDLRRARVRGSFAGTSPGRRPPHRRARRAQPRRGTRCAAGPGDAPASSPATARIRGAQLVSAPLRQLRVALR